MDIDSIAPWRRVNGDEISSQGKAINKNFQVSGREYSNGY